MEKPSKKKRSPAPRGTTRVVKRLAPGQPGALKWSRRYGDALVCVRHRHDKAHRHRYTTVELVVEKALIRRRKPADLVMLHIPFELVHVLQAALTHRAQWNGEFRLWVLPRQVVAALGLDSHIVDTDAWPDPTPRG